MAIIDSLLGGAFGLAETLWGQYAPLSNSQKQMNDFNASEAQKGRDFSAAQAELERDWQEEMYSKYNSISGKIEQARAAGVNPMYAVTGGASSPTSAHGPSVSAPVASAAGAGAAPLDLAGNVLQFSKLKAEIDQMKAYTRQANGNALLSEIDSLTRGQFNDTTIKQVMSAIKVSEADVSLKNAQVGELASRVLVQDADVKVKNAQLGEIASNISLNDASRELKMGQLREVAASIANTNEDTRLKSMQILLVGAQTRSERLMSGLLTERIHLTRSQRKEVDQHVKNLFQDYDHKAVMNAISEAMSRSEKDMWVSDNYIEQQLLYLLKYLQGIVSVNVSRGSFDNTSTTSNTSTTTVVDGNDYPTRGKIGF